MTIPSYRTLNSGHKIPSIALGVYQTPPHETAAVVFAALESGYRHIDCAQFYENEEEACRGIAKWIAKDPSRNKREHVFYTTKIFDPDHGYARTNKAIELSLERAKEIGYIDLLLLHSPQSDYERRHGSWMTFQEFVESGKVKSIGVSNYGIKHLKELLEYPDLKTKPAVNQLELHPWLTRNDLTAYTANQGLLVEAYTPLVRARKMDDPTLLKVAEDHNRTPAQILINWSLSKGFIPLPKTATVSRLASNFEAMQFQLSKKQVDTLDALNEGMHICWNPSTYPLDNERQA